jgi:hypothetical protein
MANRLTATPALVGRLIAVSTLALPEAKLAVVVPAERRLILLLVARVERPTRAALPALEVKGVQAVEPYATRPFKTCRTMTLRTRTATASTGTPHTLCSSRRRETIRQPAHGQRRFTASIAPSRSLW